MGVIYKIDTVRNLVYTKYFGRLTDDDLIGYITALSEDPDLAPDVRIIDDLRTVEDLQVTAEGISTFVSIAARSKDVFGEAMGAVISADSFAFGMTRMGSALSETAYSPILWHPFHDMQEALAWLGVDGELPVLEKEKS